MPKGEDLAVVAFLDSIIEQKDIAEQGHSQLFGSNGFQLAVKLLGAIGGEEEEEVDGSHHSMLLSSS